MTRTRTHARTNARNVHASSRARSPLARARSALILLLALPLSGCTFEVDESDEGDERLGESQPALSGIGSSVLVTASIPSPWGNETSAISVPRGNAQNLFVSYNSEPSLDRPDGTRSHCGWAYSTNSGTSWHSKDDYGSPLPGWGGLGQGWNYAYCRGDTYSTPITLEPAQGGNDRRVAMVAIGDSTKGNSRRFDVGLWTSTDGGVSFPTMMRVSDEPGAGSTTADTGSDGPKVAADPTNEAVYVYWYNSPSWGIRQNWLRKITIDSQGHMVPAPAVDITNQLALAPEAIRHPSIAIKPAAAPGLKPTIFLAYPSVYPVMIATCEGVPQQTYDVTWWLSISKDDGVTWTNVRLDRDPTWPECLSATPLGWNKTYISVAYDALTSRVMLAYSRHMDDAGGSFVGTRVVTMMWPDFVKWIPICNPELCPRDPSGAPTNCLVNGAPPVGETYCHQFGHAVTVRSGDGDYRYAAVFHDTRDSDPVVFPHPPVGDSTTILPLESDIWGYSGRSEPPVENWYTMSRITPLAANVPWLEKAKTGHPWWGDYEDGVVDLGGKFYAIWADNRDGATETRLRGTYFNE